MSNSFFVFVKKEGSRHAKAIRQKVAGKATRDVPVSILETRVLTVQK
jgi:hypothetical protein